MDTVERVRAFNRAWTEVLGLLDQGLLATEHSLVEARVIFELAQQRSLARAALRRRLDVDASYLTRVLTRLERRGLVTSSPSTSDGRALDLALTAAGRAAFAELDRRSRSQIAALLEPLSGGQRRQLTEALTVARMLTHPVGTDRTVTIRGLRPGDLGWVVERHGVVYWDELGWDSDFEALVARIVADYHADHQPALESAWIAEIDDAARAGCVFCCRRDDHTAQLRILLVEPWARGLGIGRRLVDECVDFARGAGYRTLMLWTNDVLVAARSIYQAVGFRLVDEAPHHSFGHDLVGQNWELTL